MKIMLIGRTGSGKTTLLQRLTNQKLEYKKTQMVSYENQIIDTPGEYVENKSYYRALNVISQDVDTVIFVQAANDDEMIFPPQFSTMFSGKKIYGLITKKDIFPNTEKVKKYLEDAGVEKIFETGIDDCESLNFLQESLG
ncbi:EutP/PduV family microcompartment system protein [uncultured Cetobacterium sp.]|uniref:EutP/PduV family microcompartment system protein n=1 Tax=uncultured Cetobacterium sp. TaxID=527638 RepID=UPI002611AF97|nr:EutP/PduV family microcompartment system protein [uncultured Cetobacterium sp.]